MTLDRLWIGLEQLGFAKQIRSSGTLFPWIESVHVLAIVMVVGTVALVDLRLLGIASVDKRVSQIGARMLPFTWGAFALAAVTGFLLFSSSAVTYAANLPFRLKIVCLALAGVNMALFHSTAYRSIAVWDARRHPPRIARTHAALSLGFWIAVVGFGRWIGFTTN